MLPFLLARPRAGALLRAGFVLAVAPCLMGTSAITISTGPSTGGEPANINDFELGITLGFSAVTITADDSITVLEDVDVSTGFFGDPTTGTLVLTAPSQTVDGDVTLGIGTVETNAAVLGLNGLFLEPDGSTPAGALQLNTGSGPATHVGASTVVILGESASFDQAVILAAVSGTVSVLDGLFSDVAMDRALALTLAGTAEVSFENGVLDATDLVAGAGSVLTLVGSAFEVDTGSGFLPVGFGALSELGGTLRGTLASGDSFESTFAQGGGSFTGTIVLASVPEPSTALLLAGGLVGLGVNRRTRTAG